MSQREEDKPTRKPFFEDERIPQNVKDIMLKWQQDLRARGSDLVEGEQQEYYTIYLNPPPCWRPKKTEEQQPQGVVIQASQKKKEKENAKWSIVQEEIRDFLSYLLSFKMK